MNKEEIRQEKNDILYRPDLDYDKKYDTGDIKKKFLKQKNMIKNP